MRAILFSQTMLIGICALIVSSCAYPHPGPQFPANEDALPSPSGAAPATIAPSLPAKSKPAPANPPTVSSSNVSTVTPAKKPKAPPTPAPASEPMPAPGADLAFPGDQGTASGGTDAGSGFDNVEIVDASLNGKLTVLRVGSEPSPNNLLSVFAGLKNKTARQLDLEVQTRYKDKDGNALNDGGWIPMTLKPNEETEYRSSSISEAATDFLVRVRIRRVTKPAVRADGSQ